MNISKKELARRLNTSPSNLSGKLKRDNFTEKSCGKSRRFAARPLKPVSSPTRGGEYSLRKGVVEETPPHTNTRRSLRPSFDAHRPLCGQWAV